MIQYLLLFPVIYFVTKKYDYKGLILCGLANFIYEICQRVYGMNESFYRMIVLRYILVLAFGCYIAISNVVINKKIQFLMIVSGTAYITLFVFFDFSPIITIYWKNTSLFACLFIIPLSQFLIKDSKIKCRPLELIGKASYNIFLVQMIYYNGVDYLYSLIHNRGCQILINIFICTFLGIIFYLIERPITSFVLTKTEKLSNRLKNIL